ncbi:MAG: HTH-type transcriptional regulator YofA [Paracidovorax wautersii]|uniref:HTH-type transcriptional regulator YofA n=1 Tax=Paracidovorax wautersii TaxID=1177982 RepID=A0A7V8FR99_9BURK|nr:MAG: HTH-type transcriptional regulator YofA [Paracidovorax wautersii]
MPDFDITLLRTFASVADSGGFAKASDRVHRTQSTISQQIKKLEDQAGRRLLARGARHTTLTADGERMLSYARRILSLHDEARNLFTEDLPELVRIGVTEDLAVESLPGLLSQLLQRMDHARLEVRCGLSRQLDADVDAGLLEMALYRQLDSGKPANTRALWRDDVFWVGPAHLHPEHAPVLPLILFTQGCVLRGHALAQLDAVGRPWRITYSSPNISGLLAAVRAGLGVSLLSARMLTSLAGLRVLDDNCGLPAPPAAAVMLRTSSPQLGAVAQQALDLLARHMDETTPREPIWTPVAAAA